MCNIAGTEEKPRPACNVAYKEVLLLTEEIVHIVILDVSRIERQGKDKLASNISVLMY